jgi:hypothetical protein
MRMTVTEERLKQRGYQSFNDYYHFVRNLYYMVAEFIEVWLLSLPKYGCMNRRVHGGVRGLGRLVVTSPYSI